MPRPRFAQLAAGHFGQFLQATDAGGGASAVRRFKGVAYTGTWLPVNRWEHPVVVDLAGLVLKDKPRPILLNHSADAAVGHVLRQGLRNTGWELLIDEAHFSSTDPAAARVMADLDNGFPWQLSVTVRPLCGPDGRMAAGAIQFVKPGDEAKANGRTFAGPMFIIRRGWLDEVSFVVRGADDDTSAMAARLEMEGRAMDFTAWLKEKHGLTDEQIEALTEEELAKYESEFKAEREEAAAEAKKKAEAKLKAEAEAEAKRQADAVQAKMGGDGNTPPAPGPDPVAAMRAEYKRVAAIEAVAAKADFDGIEGLSAKKADALANGVSAERFETDLLYDRLKNINVIVPPGRAGGSGQMDTLAVSAALAMRGGYTGERLVKDFGEKLLTDVDRRWRGGLGLHETILEAARANGYRGRLSISGYNAEEVMEYATGVRRDGVSAAGAGTLSLPRAFAGTMQRFMVDGYESVEAKWQKIVRERPNVKDFRDYEGLRVTALELFKDVGSRGELEYGDPLEEETYRNRVRRKGLKIGVSDVDIINDDLGVLTDIPGRFGRAGARTLNKLIWGRFNDNAAFFAASRLKAQKGTLNVESLGDALRFFRSQTDRLGEPYDLEPKFLVVGPANDRTADDLLAKGVIRRKIKADTEMETDNPLEGCLEKVSTVRITTPEWYVMADPRDAAMIEVAFLDNQKTPIVVSDRAPLGQFGMLFVAYHDAGVTLVDPNAAIKYSGVSA